MSTLFSQKVLKNNEIRPQEADFTEVLSTIAVMPKKLYFYGKIPKNRVKTVAIVGSRKPTDYGKKVAYRLAYDAAKAGAVVVSGLAYGVDSIAARGALAAGGVTIAVLGTPIDRIYPQSHRGLAEEIVERGGCVMSELAPGEEFVPKTCFLQRNRIISGLADVVVIPEAAERSGSLNTAAHALEQGREVMVVPGNIDQPMSAGCNRLIRQGAMPCLGSEDLLELLFPPERKRKKRAWPEQAVGQIQLRLGEEPTSVQGLAGSQGLAGARGADTPGGKPGEMLALTGDSPLETQILQKMSSGVDDGEKIVESLGMSASEFNQTMTLLEIKGRVRALGANRWDLR